MTLRFRFRCVLGITLACALCLSSETLAAAQEFVKVEDAVREQLPATPFVVVAYGFIWVGALFYVGKVARSLAHVRGELVGLRLRLDRTRGNKPEKQA